MHYRKDCSKYRASIRYNGKTKHIIHSNNPVIAHEEYWKEKRKIAHELLNSKYNFICEEIKIIVFERLELKYKESKRELECAINDGYFNRLEAE